MTEFRSFEEFWPFYVSEHQNRTNRMLHLVGTSTALATAAFGILTGRKWLVAIAPALGYGPAWVGHFIVEGNTPATFKHPAWSLRGDMRMLSMMFAGTMDAEVERVMAERAAEDATNADEHHGSNGADGGANGGSVSVSVKFTVDETVDPSTLN
jgi:hypothetical protein